MHVFILYGGNVTWEVSVGEISGWGRTLLLGKLVTGEVSVGEISDWRSCCWGSCDWGNYVGEVGLGK